MTAPLDDAAERLNGLQDRRRDAVLLAQAASLAVRIEPHLLRTLRLRCVPGADVGAEADLWFSPLVESRGADAIVLDAAVVRLLRERLSRDRDRLALAAALTAEAHEQAAAALQLEERITALVAIERDAAVPAIDEALRPAVRAMKEGERRGREIARWWVRAAPRMDPIVWRSENAVALLLSASVLLRRPVLDRVPQSAAAVGSLAWVLPEGTSLGSVEADVELTGRRILFHPPRDQRARIRLPATRPPIVELRWLSEGREQKAAAEVAPGAFFEFPHEPVDLTLHTLRGAGYAVTTGSDTMPEQLLTCFVVMPFGKKTDFQTGRTLDLDRTYTGIIKPAVEGAGLQCVRADEIVHSGTIDAPMFEQLLNADLVIADLSTLQANTAYELGVRHALRPRATIVMAESQVKYPFDTSHIPIRSYQHLGQDIGFSEVTRMRAVLAEAIKAALVEPAVDSPVYTFLPDLDPPQRRGQARSARPGEATQAARPADSTPAVSRVLEESNNALQRGDWQLARRLYREARKLQPNDPYILQQLVLATYKSREPDPLKALEEARALLSELDPETSNDPETIGLHGSILKRLWELTRDPAHLDGAIHAYERGFYLKGDYYNGINLAFMFNVRAALSEPAEAIADFVLARRTRRQVLAICEQLLRTAPPENPADRYWLLATMAEAATGLGDRERTAAYLSRADREEPHEWMRQSTREQLSRLEAFLRDSPLRFLAAA